MRRVFAAFAFASIVLGCTPLDFIDTGAAEVTLTRGDKAPLVLVHDPAESQIALTPPVGGVLELLFQFQDPFVALTLRVDESRVSEGERVTLPSDQETLFFGVAFDDAEFISTAQGADGFVEITTLQIDEAAGFAELGATFDVALPAADPMLGEVTTASGFVEASVGSPAAGRSPRDDARIQSAR